MSCVVGNLPEFVVVAAAPTIFVVVDNDDVARHCLGAVEGTAHAVVVVAVATAGATHMHDWLQQTSSRYLSHSWAAAHSKTGASPHSEWVVALEQ